MVYYANGRKLNLGKKIGSGGEGEVFCIDNDHVAKILTNKSDKLAGKIKLLMQLPSSPWIKAPKQVVLDKNGDLAGYVMEKAPGFQWHRFNVQTSRTQFQIEQPNWKVDSSFVFNMMISFAKIVSHLHQQGVIIGDIHDSNIFVDQYGQSYLIDFDSVQIQNFKCVAVRPEFRAPALINKDLTKTNRTEADDIFAIAVLFFHLMLNGIHPFAGIGGSYDISERISAGLCFTHPKYQPPPFIQDYKKLPNELLSWFEKAFIQSGGATAADLISILHNNRMTIETCLSEFLGLHPKQTAKSGNTAQRGKGASTNQSQRQPAFHAYSNSSSKKQRWLKKSWLMYTAMAMLITAFLPIKNYFSEHEGFLNISFLTAEAPKETIVEAAKPNATVTLTEQLTPNDFNNMHLHVFKKVETKKLSTESNTQLSYQEIHTKVFGSGTDRN